VPDYAPHFILDQAMASLDQDWRTEFPDEYAALEDWFHADGWSPTVLTALVRDIDLLFAEDADAAARLAQFPHTGLSVNTIDRFLRAIRKRALDGLAGNPEPMRAP
jgi:hypothetical protein